MYSRGLFKSFFNGTLNDAKKMLISEEEWKNENLSSFSSANEVRTFASKLKITPAIPAGRIRYESKNYKIFTNLIGNGIVNRMFE